MGWRSTPVFGSVRGGPMPAISTMRTTAFRLADEHFGPVHVYRPGERFARGWDAALKRWRPNGENDQRDLPYRGLAVALRVMTGDFVAIRRRLEGERPFLIARRPISTGKLAMA